MFKDIYSKYKTKVDAALEDYINELQDEYRELSNEDCIEITNTYADEIMSINAVYSNFENAAEETARSLGFVNDMNEAYFDFELFENSLRDNENYIELPSGVVVYITRWKQILTGGNKNAYTYNRRKLWLQDETINQEICKRLWTGIDTEYMRMGFYNAKSPVMVYDGDFTYLILPIGINGNSNRIDEKINKLMGKVA